MNTCDTCQWWEDFNLPGPNKAGGCDHPKLAKWDVFPDGLGVSDEAGAAWRPNTGPKFGCIHHEAKP